MHITSWTQSYNKENIEKTWYSPTQNILFLYASNILLKNQKGMVVF